MNSLLGTRTLILKVNFTVFNLHSHCLWCYVPCSVSQVTIAAASNFWVSWRLCALFLLVLYLKMLGDAQKMGLKIKQLHSSARPSNMHDHHILLLATYYYCGYCVLSVNYDSSCSAKSVHLDLTPAAWVMSHMSCSTAIQL